MQTNYQKDLAICVSRLKEVFKEAKIDRLDGVELKPKENLDFNISDELIEMSSEIFKISEIMRNYTLKSLIKNDKNLIEKVLEYLNLHREKNVFFYNQLLTAFE